MSDEDLRRIVRTEVLEDEPAFTMSSSNWHEAGARAVRRRRRVVTSTLSITGGVLAVTAILLAPHVVDGGNSPSHRAGTVPPAAQQVLDEFDPATFPQVVDDEVRAALGSSIPSTIRGRVEASFDGWTRLRPSDYAFSDSWTAWYDLAPTDRLMVVLQHDQSANEGSAHRYCEDSLASGESLRCAAGTLEDGSVSISQILATKDIPAGWSDVPTPTEAGHWYQRQVFNRRDYGFGVIAREFVWATSLADVGRVSSLSEDELGTLAASPRLVYQLPSDAPACERTMTMSKRHPGFANVECAPNSGG